MAFDAAFARDVVLPLAEAAYTVMGGGAATLPSGYAQTTVIRADIAALTAMTSPHPGRNRDDQKHRHLRVDGP